MRPVHVLLIIAGLSLGFAGGTLMAVPGFAFTALGVLSAGAAITAVGWFHL